MLSPLSLIQQFAICTPWLASDPLLIHTWPIAYSPTDQLRRDAAPPKKLSFLLSPPFLPSFLLESPFSWAAQGESRGEGSFKPSPPTKKRKEKRLQGAQVRGTKAIICISDTVNVSKAQQVRDKPLYVRKYRELWQLPILADHCLWNCE